MGYKVYQRLSVSKVSGSAHRHIKSGLCEWTIQPGLMMLTNMEEANHGIIWLARLPPILGLLNTSICASKGYRPFYLDHGREPRDVASRSMDTSDVPAPAA